MTSALLILLLICFSLSGLSGMALALHYVPTPEDAYASIAWVQEQLPGGVFVRSLHVFSVSGFIALAYLLVLWLLLSRAYRELPWAIWGCSLLLLVLGLGSGFTGSLLPWTQHAYWDATIRLGIMGQTPVIGPALQRIAQGSGELGLTTLPRYAALHQILLPWLLAATLIPLIRHFLPASASTKELLIRHGIALAGVALVALISLVQPAHLGAIADLASQYAAARPEWWFLPLFQLRKMVSGPQEVLWMLLLLNAAGLWLLSLPWLDRGRWSKPVLGITITGVLALLVLFTLGLGDRPPLAGEAAKMAETSPGAFQVLPSAVTADSL